MTTMEIILVTLVAAICGMGSVLDERQTHRPLVACTLIGLVLGDLETGIIVGGTLELVALGWMNVGAAMAPDAALASVIATILVIKGDRIELFNIKGNPYSSSFDRLIGLVPDLVSKLKSDKYIYLNDEQ